MQNGDTNGEASVREVERLRAHVAKLEKLSRDHHRPGSADGDVDRAWQEWERTFDAIKDPIFLVDADSRITQANLATSDFLGKPLDAIVGRPCWELVHGTDRPPAECPLVKARQSKRHEEAELYLPHRKAWVEARVSPILDEAGNLTSAVHIVRDVTDRKRMDLLIRRERDRAQKYLDVAGVMLVVIDSEQRVGLINKKGCEILGYSEDEIIGKNWFDNFLPASVRDEVKCIFTKVIQGGADGPEYYENPILTKSGEERLIALHNTILRDDQGEVIAALSSGEDITERRKAEESLAHERNLLHVLLDNIPDYIYFKDRESRFVRISKAHANTFGLSNPAEAIGKTDFDFFSDDHARQAYEEEQTIIGTGQPILNTEERETWPDRPDTWVLTSKMPLWDAQGEIIGTFGISKDITERKRAEEQYRTIVRTAMDGFWLIDNQGRFLDVNDAYCKMVGYSREELLTMRISDVEAVEKLGETAARIRKILEIGEDRFETHHKSKDGKIIDIEVSVNCVKDEERMFVFLRDITERKHAEEALRQSEEKFAKAFRATPNLMSITTLGGTIIDVNDAYCTLAGYGHDELVGRNVLEFNVWADPEQRRKMVEQVEREGRAHDLYVSLRTKSGQIRLLHFAAESFVIGGEQCLICVAKDITEYKLAEKALRESERKYRELFENAREAIVIIDMDKTITDTNKFVEEYGFKREDLIGRNYLDFAREEYRQKAIEGFEELRQGIPQEGEMDVITPRGWVTVHFIDNPIIRGGEVVGVQAILTDITERKKTEKELLDYQAKLKALAAELTLTEERQRQRIAADIHDRVSQALSISKLKLEALRSSASKRIAEELKSVCGLLAQTIAEMRTLTFDLSSPILHELGLEQALREYLTEHIEGKHGIHTEFEDDGRPKPLDNDVRSLLFRDVRELLVNVVKHAEAKQVRVSVRRDGSVIHITVKDDGVGFDPVAASSKVGKTGCFGLFSIRERLEDVGGHLEIDSSPGHGCKVTMTAPLKRKETTGGRNKTIRKGKRN